MTERNAGGLVILLLGATGYGLWSGTFVALAGDVSAFFAGPPPPTLWPLMADPVAWVPACVTAMPLLFAAMLLLGTLMPGQSADGPVPQYYDYLGHVLAEDTPRAAALYAASLWLPMSAGFWLALAASTLLWLALQRGNLVRVLPYAVGGVYFGYVFCRFGPLPMVVTHLAQDLLVASLDRKGTPWWLQVCDGLLTYATLTVGAVCGMSPLVWHGTAASLGLVAGFDHPPPRPKASFALVFGGSLLLSVALGSAGKVLSWYEDPLPVLYALGLAAPCCLRAASGSAAARLFFVAFPICVVDLIALTYYPLWLGVMYGVGLSLTGWLVFTAAWRGPGLYRWLVASRGVPDGGAVLRR